MQSFEQFNLDFKNITQKACELKDPKNGIELRKLNTLKDKLKKAFTRFIKLSCANSSFDEILNGVESISKSFTSNTDKKYLKDFFAILFEKKDSLLPNKLEIINKINNNVPYSELSELVSEGFNQLDEKTKKNFIDNIGICVSDSINDICERNPQEAHQLYEEYSKSIQNKESCVPQKQDYISFYEDYKTISKEAYEKEINELSNAFPNDSELGEISKDLHDIFKYVPHNNEQEVKSYEHLVNKIINKVAKDNGVRTFFGGSEQYDNLSFDKQLKFGTTEQIPNVKFSEDKKKKVIDLYHYAKENIFTRTEDTNLGLYMRGATDLLIKAIKEKDIENVKKYYKETKEREETIRYLFNELKEINKDRIFVSNNVDDRAIDIYPPWMFADPEVNSVVNQFLNFRLYEKTGVSIEEMMNDPLESGKKIVDYTVKNDGPNFAFSGSALEVFDKYYLDGKADFRFLESEDLDPKKDLETFNRYAESFIIINDKDTYAITNNVNNYIYGTLNAKSHVFSFFTDHALNEKEFLEESFPSKLLLGDQFDFYKHTNFKNFDLNDYSIGEKAPKFDRVQYMKENMSISDIVNKFYEIKDLAKNHLNVPDKLQESIRFLSNEMVVVMKDKMKDIGMDYALDFEKMVNGKKFSKVEQNSFKLEAQFYDNIDKKISEDTLKNSVETIGKLNKEYRSHNFFMRFISSDLKKQKKEIDKMIDTLSQKGVNKKYVEKAVDAYASKGKKAAHEYDKQISNMCDNLEMNNGFDSFNVSVTKEEIEVNEINSKEGANIKIDFNKETDFSKEEVDLHAYLANYLNNNKNEYKENKNDMNSKQKETDITFEKK